MAKVDVVYAFPIDGEEDEAWSDVSIESDDASRWDILKKTHATMAWMKKTFGLSMLPMVMRSSSDSPPPPLA